MICVAMDDKGFVALLKRGMITGKERQMVTVTGNVSEKEANAYINYLEEKYHRRLKELSIELDGEFADLHYRFEPVNFERIRRITGYLVGDMNKWNDGKVAEEADRVKHSFGTVEAL